MTISVSLPYPPSTNSIWARTKSGGVRKSDEYKLWLEAAGWQIHQQKPGQIAGKYVLLIEATRPDKRLRDIDNIIKSVSDALQRFSVVTDDCLCEDVRARWVAGGPGIQVTITPADEPQ
jgi:crossover junction endodeoxyribonuclease RusA